MAVSRERSDEVCGLETLSRSGYHAESETYLSIKRNKEFWLGLGGSKRKSMAQMEKTQSQQDKKDDSAPSKKTKAKTVVEKRPRGLQSPDVNDPKFLGEVQKMGAITPFSLASQFNLRLSVAKDVLEDLERRRLITLIGGNARIRIYQPAAA